MTLATAINLDDVLAKIDARIESYQWAADTAGTPTDQRKYAEGVNALQALRLDVQVLALPEPEPVATADPLYADVLAPTTSTKPTLVKASAGSYNVVEDGRVTWSILRTQRDDWYDHNPEYPWAVIRLFGSGGQVEARFTTLSAAKRYLLG